VKAHITLVNPPQTTGAPNSGFIPLGIGYLAAVLEEEGYAVDVIDCQVQQHTAKDLESELARLQPDVIGVTSTTLTYKSAIEIVQTAKKACPNSLTIIGGPHVTVLDEQTLNEQPEVDIIVRGEGERTLLELADRVSKSSLKDLDGVAGITFRKNGQIVQTPDRPFIQNIDELPYPAFKHFDVSKYRIFGKTYLPVITSRGCPFQCTFCLASKMCGRGFRARSPKNVVDELEFLRDTYGADAFSFYDDTFTFDLKRARDICKEMKNRKVDLQWDCRTRVDRINKEDLAVLRDANCQLIHFGVESGSQKMLNLMKKGTTVEQNARAIKWAKEAGISVAISVVVGYPGETPELLQETLDFMYRTRPDYVYMCVAIPYPGTEMYDYLNELGWEMSPRWDRYDEQTVVFKNPLLSPTQIMEKERVFFNKFFSLSYLLRQSVKKDFYSKIMARSALNHILWRVKLPRLVSATFKKLPSKQKAQQET
jgi:anaerobic magnesium-protoporphyrin IX monomethyl ester cyclase